MTQNAGKLCYALSEASKEFSKGESCDMTLMLPDGTKQHFVASGENADEEAIKNLTDYLKANLEAGQQAAEKQKKLYASEEWRHNRSPEDKFPFLGILGIVVALVTIIVAGRGWKAYLDYNTKSDTFSVEDEVTYVMTADTQRTVLPNDYKKYSGEKYIVYYEYTVDGETYERKEKDASYPFNTKTHYFYRDSGGNAREVVFMSPLGLIFSIAIVLVCIYACIYDFTEYSKAKKSKQQNEKENQG